MKISIIIPVYNAEKYLEQAVNSALTQKEVAEIVLVEDGSIDNSLEICKELVNKYDKILLAQHPNGENRGAGKTRNLGIKKASCEFLAFLDADDFYLSNRFEKTQEIFYNNPDADGVYEAIGAVFENYDLEKQWKKMVNKPLTTLDKKVEPNKLFEFLVLSGGGHFSLDGVTIKKNFIEKVGLFEEELLMSEDTHMCLKMSLFGKMLPGKINHPVTMRRIHGNNRITNVKKESLRKYRYLIWKSLFKLSKDSKISLSRKLIIEYKFNCYSTLKERGYEKDCSSFDYAILLLKFLFSHSPVKSSILLWEILYQRIAAWF